MWVRVIRFGGVFAFFMRESHTCGRDLIAAPDDKFSDARSRRTLKRVCLGNIKRPPLYRPPIENVVLAIINPVSIIIG